MQRRKAGNWKLLRWTIKHDSEAILESLEGAFTIASDFTETWGRAAIRYMNRFNKCMVNLEVIQINSSKYGDKAIKNESPW
jgi:hypothetical protein